MKKLLVIVGIIVLLPIFGFGIYILEDVYYNMMGSKVEKAALKYLDQKYGDSFEIDEVSYSKALGDDEGAFEIEAHSTDHSDITFSLRANEDYQITGDDYKENKWGNETEQEYIQLVKPIFPNADEIYASGSFPEEVADRYELDDTYQTIIQENPQQSHEYIKILMFVTSVNKEAELESIYQLREIMEGRNLRTYRLEVQYYPKKLKNELKNYDSLHQFDNDFSQEGLYDCKLHGAVGEDDSIAAPGDLAKFCREK
ncbi:hypothetical protein [Bacillus sp. FJAT-29814]|uniref:hypothetical protein n=1 Tax=Bacillus sp. FJAT-29814 TaxID=1729688 RepID=UPI00082980C8|nr:hypothetical protein [Bacillus sp. FJAT-29814]